MSRFLMNLVGITIWTFATLLLLTDCAFPEILLGVAAVNLGFALTLAACIVFTAAETGNKQFLRTAQAVYLSVPSLWALWTAGTYDLHLAGDAWLYLLAVSVLSVGVQEISFLEGHEEIDSVRVELLEAVRPILTPPPAFETGSIRIPR